MGKDSDFKFSNAFVVSILLHFVILGLIVGYERMNGKLRGEFLEVALISLDNTDVGVGFTSSSTQRVAFDNKNKENKKKIVVRKTQTKSVVKTNKQPRVQENKDNDLYVNKSEASELTTTTKTIVEADGGAETESRRGITAPEVPHERYLFLSKTHHGLGYSNITEGDYLKLKGSILQGIERVKFYPRWAILRGVEGTVLLKMKVESNGVLMNIEVLESSGNERLNKEAVKTVESASPIKRLPVTIDEEGVHVVIPLSYKLLG